MLEPIARKPLTAPLLSSGIWSSDLWPWLATLGVASATTCDVGFNYRDTPRLGLKRILDAEDVPLIEFEAEMSGYKDLLRRLCWRLRFR